MLRIRLTQGLIQQILNCNYELSLKLLNFDNDFKEHILKNVGKIKQFIDKPEQFVLFRIVFENTFAYLGKYVQHKPVDINCKFTPKLQFGIKKYAEIMGISEDNAEEIVFTSFEVQCFLIQNIKEKSGDFYLTQNGQKNFLKRKQKLFYKIVDLGLKK